MPVDTAFLNTLVRPAPGLFFGRRDSNHGDVNTNTRIRGVLVTRDGPVAVFGSAPGPSYPGEMPLKPRAAQRTQCTEQGKELGPHCSACGTVLWSLSVRRSKQSGTSTCRPTWRVSRLPVMMSAKRTWPKTPARFRKAYSPTTGIPSRAGISRYRWRPIQLLSRGLATRGQRCKQDMDWPVRFCRTRP